MVAIGTLWACLAHSAQARAELTGADLNSPAAEPVDAVFATTPPLLGADELTVRDGTWDELWRPVARQAPDRVNPWEGLYFGSSLVIAKPHLKESFQATIYQPLIDTMTLVPFSSDYRTAPRAWLGYGLQNGFGVQTRYWEYNQGFNPFNFVTTPTSLPGAQTATIIFPAAILSTIPGDVLSVSSGIEMRSLDLEATMRYELQNTQVLVSGGLRYALIRQDYNASVLSGGVPSSTLSWDRKLEGIGPLIGAQLRRPFGSWGLAVIGGGRAGLIFASKDIHRTVVSPLPAPPTNSAVNFDDADELLMNLEVDLGLEWSRRWSFGDVFVRGTYEGQLWSDSGGSALGYLGVEGFGLSVGMAR